MTGTSDGRNRTALHDARATLSACVAIEGVILPESVAEMSVRRRRVRGARMAVQVG